MTSVSKRLRRVFENSDVDIALISNTKIIDTNFLYLTGFSRGVFEVTQLVATRNKVRLSASPLDYDTAKRARPKEMDVSQFDTSDDFVNFLKKNLEGKVVGVNARFLPYKTYENLKRLSKAKQFVDISDALEKARSVKDESEIYNIRKAVAVAKKALAEIEAQLKEGATERQIADELDLLMFKNGGNGPSFQSIVCFGETSAAPHHAPMDIKLKRNSYVLIDCGAKYNAYCSDLTRTFIFKPERASAKYKRMSEIYDIVKEAQELALEKMGPGVKASAPHIAAAKHIDTAKNGKYKGTFIHTLGHPIGLEVHDMGPVLAPGNNERLEPGMVVSDEPGIYVKGFGGVRIEDDVIITNKGAKFI
ncbi:MAG: Xaa-Pro peptidase family protein [Candidatus Marsarchaeota archaeon]|nr:Xaa-Pro peptidase family protein [Candidatus Marsarchaeota archaeon]